MELPYELSDQIISYLPSPDLYSMCLVHSSHLKVARKYLYRDLSAPLTPRGLQRLLDISRDPELSGIVRTFRYPTQASILIRDMHGKPPGLMHNPMMIEGDDCTDIAFDKEIPEEYLELVEENNRKCLEQRMFLLSSEHWSMLREVVGNLRNLTALNLQFSAFTVDRALRPCVVSVWCGKRSSIDSNGRIGAKKRFYMDFTEPLYRMFFEILRDTNSPVKTLDLEGAEIIPPFDYLNSPSTDPPPWVLGAITTLNLRFNPVDYKYSPEEKNSIRNTVIPPSGKFLRELPALQRFCIVMPNPRGYKLTDPPPYRFQGPVPIMRSYAPMVHTLELEGFRIASNLLRPMLYIFRTSLRSLILRRIAVYGNLGWPKALGNIHKNDEDGVRIHVRIKECVLEDLWEYMSFSSFRKLGTTEVQRIRDYILDGSQGLPTPEFFQGQRQSYG